MNTKQLHYVLTLADEQSFSEAASKLGISQPALSNYISRLENEIGTELFDRSQSPIKLTSHGLFFVESAAGILREEQQFYRRLKNSRDGISDTLTIGISPFRSIHMMPEIIKKARSLYPDICINLCECIANDLEKSVLDGVCDFAISVLPIDNTKFDCVKLGEERIVLVIPRTLAQNAGLKPDNNDLSSAYLRYVSPTVLSDIPFVVLGSNQRLRNMYDAICTLYHISTNHNIQVVNLETAFAMVEAEIGAALLPDIYIRNESLKEKVYCFQLEHIDEFRTLAAISKKDSHLSDTAKKIIEIIKTQCVTPLSDKHSSVS